LLVSVFFGVQNLWAASIAFGPAFSLASSQQDHAKYGLSLQYSIYDESNYGYWAQNSVLFSTFSAVNPGSKSTNSAPGAGEKNEGQSHFLSEHALRTNWQWLQAETSIEALFYFPSLSYPEIGAITGAIGPHLKWNLAKSQSHLLEISSFFGLAVHQSQLPLVLKPSLQWHYQFSKSFELVTAASWLQMQTLQDQISMNKFFLNLTLKLMF